MEGVVDRSIRTEMLTGEAKRADPLRRFTPTPHIVDLTIMGRRVRFESNSLEFLDLTEKFLDRYPESERREPAFRWRVVCESDPQVQSTEVPFAAFADSGIHYVNIGQRSFLAVDCQSHEGVGFLAQRFLDEDPRLQHHLGFDFLFYLSVASLGLTALSGACVGLRDRGVLIFGPPNSGKTTTGYFAAKLGMEFHADQGVFLDTENGSLRAWGDPFPAAFRPESLDFLPELRDLTREHRYRDFSFCYLSKLPFQSSRAYPVVPICSVFLERGTSPNPGLVPIARRELATRLRDNMVLKLERTLTEQSTRAFDALGEIPAYRLRFDRNPQTAANLIRGIFDQCDR
jgi:hypothetical protein